jgi:hypothetical protein
MKNKREVKRARAEAQRALFETPQRFVAAINAETAAEALDAFCEEAGRLDRPPISRTFAVAWWGDPSCPFSVEAVDTPEGPRFDVSRGQHWEPPQRVTPRDAGVLLNEWYGWPW